MLRGSTTCPAEQVLTLVLDDGRIVEEGPPSELLCRNEGRYQRLFRLWRGALAVPSMEAVAG